ncbi:BQ5605_C002g01570 [Microbotryum silenes-dioicae]|uniref:BQ5605_C002g01570 protein n=1 Tax=Microbotryum silenes-dioicae TaxID=796604 RepID=A0A2X0M3J0_9BASI|nr:BQ5605_C002g01570 [Microbotryum silenes-dioicae]
MPQNRRSVLGHVQAKVLFERAREGDRSDENRRLRVRGTGQLLLAAVEDDRMQRRFVAALFLCSIEYPPQFADLALVLIELERPPPRFESGQRLFGLFPDLLRGGVVLEETGHQRVLTAAAGVEEGVVGSFGLAMGMVALGWDRWRGLAAGPGALHLEPLMPR